MQLPSVRSDERNAAEVNDSGQIKILSVVGARPNFMKVAPIVRAIRDHNEQGREPGIQHVLVHTGQHYDAMMSDRFFTDLSLPKPDVHLGVGAGSQCAQTAEILKKFEGVLLAEHPDIVIVVGDVTSTAACALSAAKMPVASGKARPLVAHVEAGLRSFDRTMPEEINRIVADHLADLLFVTERSGIENLCREGIPSEKVFFVGNTMIDSLLAFRDRVGESSIRERLGLRTDASRNGNPDSIQTYALLTLHRPANVDDPGTLREILEGISELSRQLPVVFPVHPRTRKNIEEFGFQHYFQTEGASGPNGIQLIDPLGYLDFVCMMKNAHLALTDSGGIQEETTCLGVPCVTIRDNTERPVTIECGTNLLAGTTTSGIRKAIRQQLAAPSAHRTPDLWDGQAAQRIIHVLRHVKQPSTQLSRCPATAEMEIASHGFRFKD
jgi:UDP-N-acetylglucosamine 2-epimerase (non-hydrolysing)